MGRIGLVSTRPPPHLFQLFNPHCTPHPWDDPSKLRPHHVTPPTAHSSPPTPTVHWYSLTTRHARAHLPPASSSQEPLSVTPRLIASNTHRSPLICRLKKCGTHTHLRPPPFLKNPHAGNTAPLSATLSPPPSPLASHIQKSATPGLIYARLHSSRTSTQPTLPLQTQLPVHFTSPPPIVHFSPVTLKNVAPILTTHLRFSRPTNPKPSYCRVQNPPPALVPFQETLTLKNPSCCPPPSSDKIALEISNYLCFICLLHYMS